MMKNFISLDKYAYKTESLKLISEDNEHYPMAFIKTGYNVTHSLDCHKTRFTNPFNAKGAYKSLMCNPNNNGLSKMAKPQRATDIRNHNPFGLPSFNNINYMLDGR